MQKTAKTLKKFTIKMIVVPNTNCLLIRNVVNQRITVLSQ